MSDHVHVDVLIFGGGITGLWAAGRLEAAGYSCIVLEAGDLGDGQTIASQGIIHAGIKYGLGSDAAEVSEALSWMPGYWQQHLMDRDWPHLSAVNVLTQCQYLWAAAGILGKAASFFASRCIRSQSEVVRAGSRAHTAFNKAPARMTVYRVEERVLCPRSLIKALVVQMRGAILKIDWPGGVDFQPDKSVILTKGEGTDRQSLQITPKHIVLAAGRNNGELGVELLGEHKAPRMQLRPLHMVMVKGPSLPPLYGHCIGTSSIPSLTVTSQWATDRDVIWYLGGALAEDGINLSPAAQVEVAKKWLALHVPWIDFNADTFRWRTLFVQRAEVYNNGNRPSGPTVLTSEQGDVTVAWPTKMAFAPVVAQLILEAAVLCISRSDASGIVEGNWPSPKIATLPWERAEVINSTSSFE